MKKRILTFAMILVMLCGLFAGCGENPYVMLASAMAKTEKLEEMSAKMDMEMAMSTSAMSITIPISMSVQAKDIKSDNPTIMTTLSVSILGQKVEAQVYQEDGWSYAVMGDLKAKTKSAPELDQYDYSDEIMQEIPEDLVKDAEIVKNSDGSVTATIHISNEKFAEIYSDLLDSMSDSLSAVQEVTVENAVVVITVAKGYIQSYNMEFRICADKGDDVDTMDVKANISYENPGQPVEITPPDGYQDFPES